MTENDPAPTPRWERAGLAAVLTAVLLVYLPAFGCGFTTWDDPAFCVMNPDVASPNLLRIFDVANRVVGDWTPLATVTYAAERALLGPAPWVPHATNVLLHLVSVYLAYRLLREVGLGLWQSLCVALLFGVHPFQVESVVWVAARKNVLVAVFSLAFLRSCLAGHHLRATGWFALALCSKATAVGLPLVAAAAHWLRIGAPRPRIVWAWIAGWLSLSAARGLLSIASQAHATAKTADLGIAGRMAYMGSVLTTQVRQLFAPTDLCVVYVPPRREWSDSVLLAQWSGLAAIAVTCVLLARRDRRLVWAGVFALAMLAPTLNVFPGPCWQADRYMHLPLIGIGMFLVTAIAPLARVRPWVPAAVFLAWVGAVCAPLTIEREAAWKSDETLWQDANAKAPNSSMTWDHMARVRADRGDMTGAVAAFRRAAELDPKDSVITLMLAIALYGNHQNAEAETVVRAMLAKTPDDGEAHALLGCLRAVAGNMDAAGAEFAEAMRLAPNSPYVRKWFNEFASHAMKNR